MIKSVFSIISALWIVLITVLSLMPTERLPKISWDLLAPDKVAHFIIYALMSLFLMLAHHPYTPQSNKYSTRFWGIQSTLIAAVYGIFIEILQGTFTRNRHFDPADIVANCLGCLLGLLIFNLFLGRLLLKIAKNKPTYLSIPNNKR